MQCEALASFGGGVPGFALQRRALQQTANIADSGYTSCIGHVIYSQAGDMCRLVLIFLDGRTGSCLAFSRFKNIRINGDTLAWHTGRCFWVSNEGVNLA